MTGQERVAYCGQLMDSMRALMERPNSRPLTSMQMKQREDRRHEMAVSLSIKGRPVRPEYSNEILRIS